MKKLVFIMPLMAISLLACNNGGEDKPEPKFCTITFDAGEGAFPIGTKTISINVEPNTSVVKAIRTIGSPLKENDKFAYFTYENGSSINYTDRVITDNIVLKANYINSTLEDLSWSEISRIATAGYPDTYFSIGDEKNVTLNTMDGEETPNAQSFAHKVRIIDFYHDDLANGFGKAGITFEFINLLTRDKKGGPYTLRWNESYNYDYRESDINNSLNGEVLNMLPSGNLKHPDLKEVIKPVNKLTGVKGIDDNYVATPFKVGKCPKLFVLAYNEMHDTDSLSVTPGEAGDSGIYAYYKGHGGDEEEDMAYRIKKIVDAEDGMYYWLRSPKIDTDNHAWMIDMEGSPGLLVGTIGAFPVAPAFCI